MNKDIIKDPIRSLKGNAIKAPGLTGRAMFTKTLTVNGSDDTDRQQCRYINPVIPLVPELSLVPRISPRVPVPLVPRIFLRTVDISGRGIGPGYEDISTEGQV